jgi:hypothetical protein
MNDTTSTATAYRVRASYGIDSTTGTAFIVHTTDAGQARAAVVEYLAARGLSAVRVYDPAPWSSDADGYGCHIDEAGIAIPERLVLSGRMVTIDDEPTRDTATLGRPCIIDERPGLVLAYTGAQNCEPFVTWRTQPAGGYYGGHYYTTEEAARRDFESR